MKIEQRSRINLFCAWCGVLYVVGLVFGWGLGGGFIIPMHRPTQGAEEIAAILTNDTTRVRISMLCVMLTAMILIPFCSVLSHFIARIEGQAGALTFATLLAGAGTVVLTFYPAIFWLIAVFRPERAPEIIHLMNDLAWLQFIGGVSIYFPLPLAIAIAAFCDDSAEPAFPRWSAYLNLLVIALILPDQLMFFFHTGPFAWNGIFGFWVPAVGFFAWFLVTAFLLRKAILRDRVRASATA